MAVNIQSSPFGSQSRTRVLLALRLLDESYARELSRLLEMPLSNVQKALRTLEIDGLVAARAVGRTRVFRLNPRYFARDVLQRFLLRLAEPENRLQASIESLRRRPRRTGLGAVTTVVGDALRREGIRAAVDVAMERISFVRMGDHYVHARARK